MGLFSRDKKKVDTGYTSALDRNKMVRSEGNETEYGYKYTKEIDEFKLIQEIHYDVKTDGVPDKYIVDDARLAKVESTTIRYHDDVYARQDVLHFVTNDGVVMKSSIFSGEDMGILRMQSMFNSIDSSVSDTGFLVAMQRIEECEDLISDQLNIDE